MGGLAESEARSRRVKPSRRFVAGRVPVSTAAIVAPLVSVTYLPLLDVPNYLGVIAVWHRCDAPWDHLSAVIDEPGRQICPGSLPG